MRFVAMFLATTLMAGPAAAQGSKRFLIKATPDRCAATADKTAGTRARPSMKLGDQPPASQVLTVYRRGPDGCPAPVVLRKGIGANPERALPAR